ncbi:hypothetical protein FRB93_000731 [Tulasnella sp. JGI-2019a]|nr:hypothetical protein FRB93_000731 [Tulasnella sp. JGI-2019a]
MSHSGAILEEADNKLELSLECHNAEPKSGPRPLYLFSIRLILLDTGASSTGSAQSDPESGSDIDAQENPPREGECGPGRYSVWTEAVADCIQAEVEKKRGKIADRIKLERQDKRTIPGLQRGIELASKTIATYDARLAALDSEITTDNQLLSSSLDQLEGSLDEKVQEAISPIESRWSDLQRTVKDLREAQSQMESNWEVKLSDLKASLEDQSTKLREEMIEEIVARLSRT